MKRSKRLDRGVIRITGDDTENFLQGLISNDIRRADGKHGLYAALLTPQGKYLFDFFIVHDGEALLVDCYREDIDLFVKKLTMFKLRSKVTLENVSADFDVYALFGNDASTALKMEGAQLKTDDGCIFYADPRLDQAGVRAFVPSNLDITSWGEDASDDEYHYHRISLGLVETPLDLIKDKSILLESGFDELSGVDWKKGCYMGQELTARTKYRGLIKKRLIPIKIMDGAPATGSVISYAGKTVGDVRSVSGDMAIAMLKLDAIQNADTLDLEDATAAPVIPNWMQLPEPDDEADNA